MALEPVPSPDSPVSSASPDVISTKPLDVILRKRDGGALSDWEIQYFVRAVVEHTASDAQIASFLMAVFQRGLDRRELAALTTAMRFSGETFDSSGLGAFCVDKHSTGGVGDKTSLLVAPIVAAAGLKVPMISGRSLGHTGGTLDKLETIPGYRTQLTLAEFGEVLARCGASMVGQTPALVPADRILYALRDHTGTVESPELICASIMSKKLAEGLDALVLDVKTGSGAFMARYEDAEHLARLMVATGEVAGTRTVALLTSMEEPLGRFSGNWVEVWECVDILKNERHAMSRDLIELSNVLAGWMLFLGGKAETPEKGALLSDELLQSGAAYREWCEMVALQGGDISFFESPGGFHAPVARHTISAGKAGYLAAMDCRTMGWAVQRLGAGRTRPGDPVAAHAGIEMHVKLGDRVEAGQAMVTLFAQEEGLIAEAAEMVRAAVTIRERAPAPGRLIREVITREQLGGEDRLVER
ncbi:MAG TPA: thymidine phosphorylase [Granulicella sp.]|jgi:pyrimidine-nucleoside phosphorylase|nr:thymidine phosphorylase [Granulicella sp.]